MSAVSTPLEFLLVPDVAKKSRPWAQEVNVGPPPGVSDEECLTANALVEPGQMGGYKVNEWRTFFKPSEEQLKLLAAGGSICFVALSGQMVPHRGEVWPAETPTAPAVAQRVELYYGLGTKAETFDVCNEWFGKENGERPTLTTLKNVPERAINLAERITVRMSDNTSYNIKERAGINE